MPNIENPQILGALLVLAGVIVGAVSSWILAFINRRFDDRRHLRELAIKTAVSLWERELELAKLRSDAKGASEFVAPVDSYIIHMLLLAELLSRKKIAANEIAADLARIREVSHKAADSVKPQRRENS